jgi:hypothetical protein
MGRSAQRHLSPGLARMDKGARGSGWEGGTVRHEVTPAIE